MRSTKIMFLLLAALCLLLCATTAGCATSMAAYYAAQENYISASGTVSFLSHPEDKQALYIGFQDLTYKFDDTCFKITGDNYELAVSRGILEYLQPGTQVVFTTAPRYFGDGYVMPIAAITINGNTFLDFEEGFANLTAMYAS